MRGQDLEGDLLQTIVSFRHNPLGFVQYVYPWGERGTPLEKQFGPQPWQAEILVEIGAVLAAKPGEIVGGIPAGNGKGEWSTASGKGIGKSALVSWISHWAVCTAPDTKGVVTAGTEPQLRTKTWPELAKWHRMLICKHWFHMTATSMYAADPEHEKTWRVDAIPWNASNPEAFAGLHNQGNRIVVIFDEACFDDKTEVLTEDGWALFANLTGNERLLSMDRVTGLAEYRAPTRLFVSHRRGEMLHYNARGGNVCVTPNHKLWHGQQGTYGRLDMWRLTEAQDLSDAQHRMMRHVNWGVQGESTFTLPGMQTERKVFDPLVVDTALWMEFLGWFCSEGHVQMARGRACGAGLTQADPKVLARLSFILTEMGFNPKTYPGCSTPQVRVHDMRLGAWLLQWGKSCLEKRIPSCVRHASREHIKIFLEAFTQGDGYAKTGSRHILYTSSKAMADDLQEVALKAGAVSVVRPRSLAGLPINFKTHTATSSVDGWIVSVAWSKQLLGWRNDKVRKIDYDGMVYCAELPPHNLLFTRREGYCLWTGNSQIDDAIYNTTDGIMTDADTEVIKCDFGNPTRSTGRFHDAFGKRRHRTRCRQIDSRNVPISDKAEIAKWIEDYGEDSDYVRVNVRGQFPRVSSMQFISSDVVAAARTREANCALDDALILGVDIGRYGDDASVLALRKGRDARSLPWIELRGASTMQVVGAILNVKEQHSVDQIFIDEGGVGGGVVDRLRELGHQVRGIQFGAKDDRVSIDVDATRYANKRAQMWGYMREWMVGGAVPDDEQLQSDCCGTLYGFRDGQKGSEIILEKKEHMKARGLASPDKADALALTFAYPVAPRSKAGGIGAQFRKDHEVSTEYDIFG